MGREFCTTIKREEAEFKDFNDFLSSFYCRLKKVEGHHIFECWRNENGRIRFTSKEGNLEDAPVLDYKTVFKQGFYGRDTYPKGSKGLKEAIAHRKEMIASYPTKTVPSPGIPAIKQVGMHENYRPLVEDKYKNDELYKKPSLDVYDS